uniref:Uncharacterized protein n=1 Tax=Sinocyclocheilus anshuiensis TaxID=1608454 RepID=A0A671PB24_9TELE
MAESAASQYEDQFICSVCLDRLKEPVTIPCGHSYCMSCITDCWGQKEQEPPYRCPQCRESFSQRPLLKKNTLIAEMMETLQKTSLQTAAVECDVCTTEKKRAVKSCLQCLASFCQTHLQLHYQSPAFMKHKLVEASRFIQENICLKPSIWHHITMDTCLFCLSLCEAKGIHCFTSYVFFSFQSCQSVCVLPSYEDVPSFSQHTHLSFKDISISAFREVLEDVCQQQTARIFREVSNVHVAQTPEPKTPDTFWQYFCQLQMDPNTAHKELKLSEENRKILGLYEAQQYPDHPERFDGFHYILCREGLCGRCYWEVDCCGDIWAVAVCYKGIDRKGRSDACRLGSNKKSWRLSRYQQNAHFIHNNKEVYIPAVRSSRIGVYLDHRAGTLCFYRISDTMTLLHRVQTTFTEPLYPAFLTGKGSSVRIIEQRKILCLL